MRTKRNKLPIKGSLGTLQSRAIFKNKHRNPLLGWYRPQHSALIQPLKVDYSHR